MLLPIVLTEPASKAPRSLRPIGVRDDLALEILICEGRGDIERKAILLDALISLLNPIETAALLFACQLPPAASATLFGDVVAGLRTLSSYRLALVRLDLDQQLIDSEVAARFAPAVLLLCDADEILTAPRARVRTFDPNPTFATASSAVVAGD